VLHFPEQKAYALLITLNKSDKDFSATTLYKDYPINLTRLHWESQSGTTQACVTGQNLVHHAERPISIVWQLEHPMPAELLEANRVGG